MGFFKKKTAMPELQISGSNTHTDEKAGTEQEAQPQYNADTVVLGLAWYQTHYRGMVKLAMTLGMALMACCAVIALLVLNRPAPVYFAATPNLQLAPMVPLDQPVLTEQGLLNWVSDTVTGAISLDFLEWRNKLSRTRENFDEDAFKSFLNSLTESGILDMVTEKRLSVSAVITKAPVITASGAINGRASWRIEFPLLVSYESSQGVESTQKLMANVLVRRASTLTTPRGMVIQQIVLKRDS